MRRVLAVVAVLVVLPVLPTAVAGGQEFGSDTLSIVKEGESPSNAEIAVRLSESTDLGAVDTVVIGRDDGFADSLASGVLQGTSPLLLVPTAGPLPARVVAELERLGPARVILLGGEAALAPAVADELTARGYAVERRAGASRFETAVAVAATDAPAADTAILARAFAADGSTDPTQAFADALSAGGMAAELGWPVLLTQTDVLTAPTRAHLLAAGIQQVKIIGGTAAVSAAVEDELAQLGITTERLAGPSRAATAIAVAEERGAPSAADVARVTLVQGQAPDAWAGGFAAAAHSARYDAPIVLGVGEALPDETAAWLEDGVTGGGAAYAVDPTTGEPVITCVVLPDLCEAARLALGLPPRANEEGVPPYGFADAVVRAGQGDPAATEEIDPAEALGPPDCPSDVVCSYSMGFGGDLVLEFTDNVLSGSGDDRPDLFVYEVGPLVEATRLEVSEDGVTFTPLYVGDEPTVEGATATVDVDAHGIGPDAAIRFVRLVDAGTTPSGAPYYGADIDAIGAISGRPA
jgi:putative cell wall-binding protein